MAPENCMDCPHHQVVADPDPHDSFCGDDLAVLCTLSENTTESKYHAAGRGLFPYTLFQHRPVTVSARPYALRKEGSRPSWCPLLKNTPAGEEPPSPPDVGPVIDALAAMLSGGRVMMLPEILTRLDSVHWVVLERVSRERLPTPAMEVGTGAPAPAQLHRLRGLHAVLRFLEHGGQIKARKVGPMTEWYVESQTSEV